MELPNLPEQSGPPEDYNAAPSAEAAQSVARSMGALANYAVSGGTKMAKHLIRAQDRINRTTIIEATAAAEESSFLIRQEVMKNYDPVQWPEKFREQFRQKVESSLKGYSNVPQVQRALHETMVRLRSRDTVNVEMATVREAERRYNMSLQAGILAAKNEKDPDKYDALVAGADVPDEQRALMQADADDFRSVLEEQEERDAAEQTTYDESAGKDLNEFSLEEYNRLGRDPENGSLKARGYMDAWKESEAAVREDAAIKFGELPNDRFFMLEAQVMSDTSQTGKIRAQVYADEHQNRKRDFSFHMDRDLADIANAVEEGSPNAQDLRDETEKRIMDAHSSGLLSLDGKEAQLGRLQGVLPLQEMQDTHFLEAWQAIQTLGPLQSDEGRFATQFARKVSAVESIIQDARVDETRRRILRNALQGQLKVRSQPMPAWQEDQLDALQAMFKPRIETMLQKPGESERDWKKRKEGMSGMVRDAASAMATYSNNREELLRMFDNWNSQGDMSMEATKAFQAEVGAWMSGIRMNPLGLRTHYPIDGFYQQHGTGPEGSLFP